MELKQSGTRLNKYLADSGVCSRREADRLIAAGKVTVNGRTGAPGDRVQTGDSVLLNGRALTGQSPKVYIALNKPVGVVCTADPREPMNVLKYLNYPVRVFPIGRLDKDSSGLLLLTSDGEIVNRMLKAAGGHEKEYLVVVDQAITPEFLEKMGSGVEILDTVTLPCKLRQITQNSFTLTLVQGLNRQIRRMCDALGYRVRSLKRTRVMNISLGDLEAGHWRELTDLEIEEMFRMLGIEKA